MPNHTPWHSDESAKPVVARAQSLLTRVEAAITAKPVNVSRFRQFRTELRIALAESESYLRWTLSDWAAAIDAECRMVERCAVPPMGAAA